MNAASDNALLGRITDRLLRAALAISSAEQVVQDSATPQGLHARRRLREAGDHLDAVLHEIQMAGRG